jgi:hypothetical protein
VAAVIPAAGGVVGVVRLSEPGGTLGVSTERVRQVEQSALGTLREHSVHGGPG